MSPLAVLPCWLKPPVKGSVVNDLWPDVELDIIAFDNERARASSSARVASLSRALDESASVEVPRQARI